MPAPNKSKFPELYGNRSSLISNIQEVSNSSEAYQVQRHPHNINPYRSDVKMNVNHAQTILAKLQEHEIEGLLNMRGSPTFEGDPSILNQDIISQNWIRPI